MTDELVTVAVFTTPAEAGMAKSELEAFGVPAFVADEFTITANPLYSNALGGVKVRVPASRAQEARDILSPDTADEEARGDLPEEVPTPQRVKAKTFVWLYLLIGAAAAAVTVFLCSR